MTLQYSKTNDQIAFDSLFITDNLNLLIENYIQATSAQQTEMQHIFSTLIHEFRQIKDRCDTLMHKEAVAQKENNELKIQLEQINKKYESLQMRLADAYNNFAHSVQTL